MGWIKVGLAGIRLGGHEIGHKIDIAKGHKKGDIVPAVICQQTIGFVYHEVHEDHEVFFNLISLCVLRALCGDILSR